MATMNKIWAHGYNCDCPQCEHDGSARTCLVFDREGEDLDNFELPDNIGESVEIVDQHGRRFRLKHTGWIKTTD